MTNQEIKPQIAGIYHADKIGAAEDRIKELNKNSRDVERKLSAVKDACSLIKQAIANPENSGNFALVIEFQHLTVDAAKLEGRIGSLQAEVAGLKESVARWNSIRKWALR